MDLSYLQRTVDLPSGPVTIQAMGPDNALAFMARLVRLIGGASAGVVDIPLGAKSAEEWKAQVEKSISVGAAINGLLTGIDPEQTPALIRNLVRASAVLPAVTSERQFVDWYGPRFTGRTDELFALVAEIIAFNYGPPLEWLKKTALAGVLRLAALFTELAGAAPDGDGQPSLPS